MAASLELRLPLTLAFVAVGAYCVARCARPASRGGHAVCDRLAGAAHAAMSAAMVVALWAPRSDDRWGLRPAVFAVCAGWFLVRATGRGHSRPHRIGLVHQGVTMVAMCWMLLAASPVGGGSATRMRMPGAGGPSTGALTTAVLAGYLAFAALWWLRAATVTGSAARASTADGRGLAGPAVSKAALFGSALFGAVGEATCQALMAAAMGVALLASL